MKAYIVQMGEDYSEQELVKGFLDKEKAIYFAQELADNKNEKIKKYDSSFLYKKRSEKYWYSGLESIEIVEIEIES